MELKDRLKLVRKNASLSQSDFGKAIGISGSQIGCYENNLREITERSLNAICREFNVNKEWLLEGTGEMYSISKEEDELAKAFSEISLSGNERLKELVKKLNELDEIYIDSIATIIDGILRER